MISKNGLTYEEYVTESLRTDPEYAAQYVASVLDEGTQQELLVAIQRVADARGGNPELVRNAELNATLLYRTLSPQVNPELKTLTKVLHSFGMKLTVIPLEAQLS